MPIFNIRGSKLDPIKERGVSLEKDIQKFTEENLETVFGLQFVRTEFPLNNLRIDTLAFDKESNAFVIIEYKLDKSFSVIDQGYSYLALMLNNKADFILEYNERLNANLKKDEVDWSQSRVLFLARTFTTYQKNAISFKDLPIELWEIKIFDNSTILYNQLLSPEAKESVRSITKNKTIESVSKEVQVFTIEDHMDKASENTRELFETLREKIINLGQDITEVPKKQYIAFKTSSNFVDVVILKDSLKLFINIQSGKLNDPLGKARDLAKPQKVGHWGNGDYEYIIKANNDITYAMDLITQSYKISQE